MKEEAQKRILLLDGSWGVMIQGYKLERRGFPRRAASAIIRSDLKGNNDLLTLTKPDIIRDIGHAYLEAGADYHRDQHLQLQLHLARPITAWTIWSAS